MGDFKNHDMWTPYKELQSVVDGIVTRPTIDPLKDLDNYLQKHKQNFINLLENPPKKAQSREDLKKGWTEGINLPGMGHQILSKDLVDEAIILSDMYNLDEYQALDLLCTAQQQMAYYPGLPRGLVAVLLYYDGRRALVSTLRTLVQARAGISWSLDTNSAVTDHITDYTDKLMEYGLITKILSLLSTMDLAREIELLQQNRAFGGPKHHRQVVELLEDTKQILADIVHCWAAQCGLPCEPTIRLIQQLKRTKLEEGSTGGIDGVTLTLQMALLCALDLSILQRREDGEDAVQLLPLKSDPDFLPTLHRELALNSTPWECEGLQAITYLAWGLVLATIRLTHHSQPAQGMLDEDDLLVDLAVNYGVFDFMQKTFLENSMIYKEEIYLRRLHSLVTDFIVFMPLKVKELRSRADEAARTIQTYAQEGLEPPSNLSHHFEQLLLTIARLYRNDPLHLGLVLDYWCPTEGTPSSAFPFRSHTRQVSLFKFVRGSADNLSPSLYVAYMRMLCSLSSTPQAARHCFNLLKQNGPISGCSISWDHFFTSLNRYYCNLRQEMPPKADTVYHHRIHPRGITPQEIQGLQAVLGLTRAVAEHDEVSRAALCENPTWQPLAVLLGFVSCSVPIALKAELLCTLAALANAPDTAAALWVSMEAAQILSTIPSTSSYQPRGVQTELEEIESRAEEFPLTRAMLTLLDVLTNFPVPRLLGVGSRTPGFNPYLNYILHSVFLRAHTRSYKQPQEKWEITRSCLTLLVKFLNQYDPEPEDFQGARIELQSGGSSQVNPPPGFHLMVDLHSKSEVLRLVLYLLDEGCALLDSYAPFPGKEALEASMLGCLQLIDRALSLQQRFLSLLSGAGSNLLLTGLSRLLLGLNPRTGKPDHLVSIAKYITYNNWLSRHSLAAVHILLAVTSYPTATGQLVGMFTSSQSLKLEIRHGFVECLEAGEDVYVEEDGTDEDSGLILKTKEMIIKLMQMCLNQAPPNLAHYLLGFQLSKDVSKTVFQQPGVMGFPRTCLHSLLTILDTSLKSRHTTAGRSNASTAHLLESAYGLLYSLCAGSRTSQPVLRFLRTSNNFLARHLSALPFVGPHSASELNQMSWLLKMVAVELKVSATRQQHSHLASLARILVSSHEETARGHQNDVDEFSDFPDFSRHIQMRDLDSKPYDKLMLQLLALLDISSETFPTPSWEFFEPKQVEQVFTQCENSMAPGLKLVDVKRLHRILMDELAAVQGNSTAGQRQLIVEEIQAVLKYALERNKERSHSHANVRFMDAWRQAVGVLFCVVPLEVLPCPGRLQILLDTLHLLINKVLTGQMTSELASLTSNALLLLLVNLRHSYVLGERSESGVSAAGHSQTGTPAHQDMDSMALAGGLSDSRSREPTGPSGSGSGSGCAVLEENSAKLNVILSGILQWMLGSGVASQKLRANLYSSLLSFMHIVCLPERARQGESGLSMTLPDPMLSLGSFMSTTLNSSISRSPTRQERKSPLQASLDLVLGFGEGVVDVMCHDGTGGHDVCKMLALSCLDKLIELDPHSSWISFLSGRGYLKHLIDSLLDSDADGQLEAMLHAAPESLRPLYVYESKMALLCRVASTRTGAEMLLEQKALSVMASMKVFDHHPIMHSGITELNSTDFIPPVGNRYLQILLPALHLCDAVLTSLGMENQSCVVQVIHFLLSHVQTVGLVLGSASPFLPLSYLKELVHVTGVIARSANRELYSTQPDDSPAALDRKAHLLRIQSLMLALFPHFIISEPLLRKLSGFSLTPQGDARRQEGTHTSEERGEAVLYVLQVAAHLLLYARNLAGHGASDFRNVQLVFKPSMATQRSHSHSTVGDYGNTSLGLVVGGERGGEAQPGLGVVVEQLVAGVAHYRNQRGALELLTRKLASLPELSTMELQEFLPEGTSAVEQRALAAQQLKVQVERKKRELALTSYIIDNCLYLVWLHLDFYLQRGLPQSRSKATDTPMLQVGGASLNATWPVSLEDISQMKQSLVSIFNDSFSKNLVDTKQSQSEMEKGFIEALLRRIKRLLQFVPVK